MKKQILAVLLLACAYVTSYSQSFKYRNYKFNWAGEKTQVIPVEEQFKNEDAVILEEKCIYNAGGNRIPGYYYFNLLANYFYVDETYQNLSPIVQKHLRIKFLTQKGIEKYRKINLPESFDPASDWSTVRPERRSSCFRPKGEFECIRYFAARIIKADGKISNAVVDESIETEIEQGNTVNKKFYSWIFKILNLEVGDELELDYSYEGALNMDPSTRVFFNGDLPKQNYSLTFRYPAKSIYMLNYHNGAKPTDSIMVTPASPHYTEYYFSEKNLAGGIRQSGGRPHLQMPFLNYYQHKNDYGIEDPKTKFIAKPLPYPWSYILLPFTDYQYENLKIHLKKMDKTTTVMNDFLKSEKQKVKDTSFAGIMSSIQHTFADEFIYKDDLNEISNDNVDLERLGKHVEKKIIRERSRFRLYREVFIRLDKDFYRLPLYDKRTSVMDINQYEYLTTLRSAYAIKKEREVIYYYPKSSRFGYEASELPFYYEDISTVLIPQHEPSPKKYELVPQISFTFLKTPFSGVKHNVRNTTVMVTASLDSLKMDFNAKLKLGGQFSTLTRGYYLYGDRDTTVNPGYYNSIASLADAKAAVDIHVTNVNRQFPFEASVSLSFSAHSIKKENNETYSIDLSDWFNNVIEEDFSAINRTLDYYPDFQFQDLHKYMVKFDKKVQLKNSDQLQKEISNFFADYQVKTTQVDDTTVLIETNYIVKAAVVPVSATKDVEEIFTAIKNSNKNSLVLKIL